MNPLYPVENHAQVARAIIPPIVVGIILTYLWLIHHFWLGEAPNETPAEEATTVALDESGSSEEASLTNGFDESRASEEASIAKVSNNPSIYSGTKKKEGAQETDAGMDLAA